MKSVTAEFVQALTAARAGHVPQEAIDTAKACLLDTLGVAAAGQSQELVDILDKTLAVFEGAPQATLWRRGRRGPMHEAALVNGAAAHALDFDDMHIASAMHPSAPVVAAALAVAEHARKSGIELLRAIALGIEAEIRIGAAVNPSHYKRGWHATGTLGHFGAAIAVSVLMGLSDEQTVAALGIAGTQACGLKETFGTMTKPLHAGLAARNGIMAALLAARGFTSASDILGGSYGFGAVSSDDPAWNKPAWRFALTDWSVGSRPWSMYGILYKTHASSFCTQALIEAVLALRAQHGLRADQVHSMRGEVSRNSIENARIAEPNTGMEAKFSLPHAMAQALAYGQARAEDFTDARVREPGLRSLRALTAISEGSGLAWPEAIATIHTASGQTLRQHVDLRQRSATAKDKWAVVEPKFMSITAGLLKSDAQSGVVQAVQTLDEASSIEQLMKYMA